MSGAAPDVLAAREEKGMFCEKCGNELKRKITTYFVCTMIIFMCFGGCGSSASVTNPEVSTDTSTEGEVSVLSMEQNILVFYNNSELFFDQPPIIVNNRTLVPLRAIFEAMGASVEWDQNTQTVTSRKNDTTISLTIGSDTMYKNGESIMLDVPAQVVNNRTLVPVRAISEAFGADVEWNNDSKVVNIIDNKIGLEYERTLRDIYVRYDTEGFMSDSIDASELKYFKFDIDHDGIEELIVRTDMWMAAPWSVYTFEEGHAVYLMDIEDVRSAVFSVGDDNCLYVRGSWAPMDDSSLNATVFKVEKNEKNIEVSAVFSYSSFDKSVADDIYDNEHYYHYKNGSDITVYSIVDMSGLIDYSDIGKADRSNYIDNTYAHLYLENHKSDLIDTIKRMFHIGGYITEFDYSKPKAEEITEEYIVGVTGYLFFCAMVGENEEWNENGTWKDVYGANSHIGDYVYSEQPDPLNLMPFYYSVFDAKGADWILVNIFNREPNHDFAPVGLYRNEARFYYYDGCYYVNTEGLGGYMGELFNPVITDYDYDDEVFTIFFTFDDGINPGTGTAKMKINEVDGKSYWSILSYRLEVPERSKW